MFPIAGLLGGAAGGGGGTSINPDMSQHANSESGGTFGDHSVGFGGNWKQMAILGAAVVLALFVWRRK